MKFSLLFAAVVSVVAAQSSAPASMSASATGAAGGDSAKPPGVQAATVALTLPQCALQCFIDNVPKVCPKGINDYGCQCKSQNIIRPLITPCVLQRCPSQDDQVAAARVAALVCSTYFKAQATVTGAMATVNIPTAVQFGPLSYAPSLHENAAMSTGLPMLGAALGALAMAAM